MPVRFWLAMGRNAQSPKTESFSLSMYLPADCICLAHTCLVTCSPSNSVKPMFGAEPAEQEGCFVLP